MRIPQVARRYVRPGLAALLGAAALAAAGCGSPAPAPAPAAPPPPPPGPRVIVSDETGGRLVVIDPESGQVLSTLAVGKRPRGIRVSHDGTKLYVALSG